MSVELLGNIIAVGAVLIVCMLICAVMKCLLDDEPVPREYKYCEDCKYGMCFDVPKSKDCQKWVDEQRGEKE